MIGSKSSDVEIAKLVIEIKTAIERIREMIQKRSNDAAASRRKCPWCP